MLAISLVDHDQQELDTLSGYLHDSYTLFRARNERDLMKTIETNNIHLIISSIDLNYNDGGRLCALLKSSEHYSHIPVILLIGKDTMPSRLKSLESGADAYIERPLSPVYLKAQVKNLIANRARIKDYFAHSLFAHMSTTSGSKTKEGFLNRLNGIISEHLSDPVFDVDRLAGLMNMSRPTLYRKVSAISALSPNELINVARLNKAAELISTADHRIFTIARMVGFNSRSNFGKAFFNHFKVTPKAYQKLTTS
jgi:AraC-like DNA-binding protein